MHPDADLLLLCADLGAAQAVMDQWSADQTDDTDGEAASEEWNRLVTRIIDTPAQTLAGVRAKADVLRTAICEYIPDNSLEREHRLALSLVKDLLATTACVPY
ncbi:hypothetical protein [Rhodovastum atsumiense]|uniref:hypothetical protein n=1 Tax=Rhodovastum atsumiense TaxID=504468 RepID=UPI0020242A99|nr:hypothetical protein [Rhodovastum atsumiense]